MFTGDFMRATVYGDINGIPNPIINTWDFRCLSASADEPLQNVGEDIVSAFLARYYTPLLTLMSIAYTIRSVTLRQYGDAAAGYDEVGLELQGGGSGPMMPAFVTYSVQLTRNNFVMRNGRKAYPAVPTSVVTGAGLVGQPIRDLFETVFEGWTTTDFTVEAGTADFTFGEYIVRKPASPNAVPTVFSPVSGYTLKGFGTQNSRKS